MKPIEVSQVNSYIKRILQTEPMLASLAVVGEISNLKFHSSGNVYFSLKDDKSKLNCFLGSENFRKMDTVLKEGTRIIASGSIFVYEILGNYSLNIKYIEISGVGNLSIEFEKLKIKLEKEGLFSINHKLDLPKFPKKIGVVTSPSGAVVHDIIKTIKSKNTMADIIIFPVLVSGAAAANEISSMIDDINKSYSFIDVLIIGRGGGSIEELWAFNEEKVARSIFNSNIPIISAVGHETDFTISDFVADVRAATPTAAALIAVADTYQNIIQIDELADKLYKNLIYRIKILEMRLSSYNLDQQRQALILKLEHLNNKIFQAKSMIYNRIKIKIEQYQSILENNKNLLEAISPEAMFKKGYSVVLNKSGNLVNDEAQVCISENISIVQARRILECEIKKIISKEVFDEKQGDN